LKIFLSTELHYFPCINWFMDVIAADGVLFNNDRLFKRSTFRNRMVVPGSNGIVSLSIPLEGGRSVKLPFHKINIDYSSTWQRDHFRSLESVYGNAPFFFQYRDELSKLYQHQIKLLVDWNLCCLNWIFSKTKLAAPNFLSSFDPGEAYLLQERNDFYLPSNHKNTEKGPFEKYPQIFEDKIGFQPNMSVLDLLFNLGPKGINHLVNSK